MKSALKTKLDFLDDSESGRAPNLTPRKLAALTSFVGHHTLNSEKSVTSRNGSFASQKSFGSVSSVQYAKDTGPQMSELSNEVFDVREHLFLKGNELVTENQLKGAMRWEHGLALVLEYLALPRTSRTEFQQKRLLSKMGQTKFLSQFNKAFVEKFLAIATYKKYPRYSILVKQGEVNTEDSLFFLSLRGFVSVRVSLGPVIWESWDGLQDMAGGIDMILGRHVATLTPGDNIGQGPLQQLGARTATIVCLTPVEVLQLSAKQLLGLLKNVQQWINFFPANHTDLLLKPVKSAEDINSMLFFFQQVPFIRQFDEEFQRELILCMKPRMLFDNDVIVAPGLPKDLAGDPNSLHILLKGSVRVHSRSGTINECKAFSRGLKTAREAFGAAVQVISAGDAIGAFKIRPRGAAQGSVVCRDTSNFVVIGPEDVERLFGKRDDDFLYQPQRLLHLLRLPRQARTKEITYETARMMATLSFFQQFTWEELMNMVRTMTLIAAPRTHCVHVQGTPCRGLYVVISGQCEIRVQPLTHISDPGDYHSVPVGKRKPGKVYGPVTDSITRGDTWGLSSLLTASEVANASMLASQGSDVVFIELDESMKRNILSRHEVLSFRPQTMRRLLRIKPEERTEFDVQILADLMNSIEFCCQFTRETRLRLAQRATYSHFKEGEPVIYQGDKGSEVYILFNGTCSVFQLPANAARFDVSRPQRVKLFLAPKVFGKRLGVLATGSVFGDIGGLTGGERTASVIAKEACEVIELDKEMIHACVDDIHGQGSVAERARKVLMKPTHERNKFELLTVAIFMNDLTSFFNGPEALRVELARKAALSQYAYGQSIMKTETQEEHGQKDPILTDDGQLLVRQKGSKEIDGAGRGAEDIYVLASGKLWVLESRDHMDPDLAKAQKDGIINGVLSGMQAMFPSNPEEVEDPRLLHSIPG